MKWKGKKVEKLSNEVSINKKIKSRHCCVSWENI